MGGGSDTEDEKQMAYQKPTLVERIGPDEARRLLMDDDDLGALRKAEADDEKSIHSEQQSEKSAISHKSHQSSKSLLSEKSTTSLRSTKSNISEAASMKSMSSQKSGMSEISIKSGASIKSGISQISGVSGMSQTSLRSGRSEISGISQISGLSKASATSSRISAATNITTASERSLLSEVQHENFYPEEIPEPFKQTKNKKEKRRKARKVFESESDCESEKSDVSERSTVSSTAESTAESAVSAHSRSSLVSHLSAKSSGTDVSDASKIASRFARGPLNKASDIEVSMATDITSDHRTSMAMSSAVESDSMVSETETEFEDEDLAEVRAGSAILPNLSICIDRDDEPGYEIVFVKIRDEGSSDSPTKVVRNNMKLARISEEEWNLARGIPVLGLGIDKHSPAEIKKQQARAKRFGLDINKNMEEGEVDEDVINRVHEDIIKEYQKRVEELNEGLNLDEMSEGQMIKPSSVTVFGCKELNTEQLLNFFKAYAPDKVDWVDDERCKLLWHEESAAVRCILSCTHTEMDLAGLQAKAQKLQKDRAKPKEKKKQNGETINLDDEEEEMDFDIASYWPFDGDLSEPRDCVELFLMEDKKLKLSIRSSTESDQKIRGAQSKSKYYVKYGNPNYGGMRGLLTKTFKRRYNYKKTREEIRKMGERLGVSLKAQESDYNPNQEKLDSSRAKADVELINSSVDEIPEAIPVDSFKLPAAPLYSDSESSAKEGVFGRRLYSQSETSDSEPEVRKSRSGSRRGSIKDRLGSLTPKKEIKTERNEKKRNELTGLTITLSQNANDKKKSEDSKKRKRSYETMESDSDVSEVSSAQSYRNQGRRGSKYSESESESVKSYGSNVTSSSATSAASSRISTSSEASKYGKKRKPIDHYESDSSVTSGHSATSSRVSASSFNRSNSEYDSDTAHSDSAHSEVSYIGRRDSKRAYPSATICKLAVAKNLAAKKRPLFGGKFDKRKLDHMNMTIDVHVDRRRKPSQSSGMETD